MIKFFLSFVICIALGREEFEKKVSCFYNRTITQLNRKKSYNNFKGYNNIISLKGFFSEKKLLLA